MSSDPVMSVAVVIPTYNHAHFLDSAIKSVLSQSRRADEIVVVDDGSVDRPETITSEYDCVRIVRQVNAGLSAARNRGIAETGARLLMFLDADDRLKPDTISLLLQTVRAHPDAGFAYGGYELVYPDNRRKRATFYPVFDISFGDFLEMNRVGMHGTVLYRRDVLEEVGGFNPALAACEDYDLYLRIAKLHKIACRPDVLAEYWHHGGNMSHDPAFMLRWNLAVIEARREDADAAGLLTSLEQGKRWARNYYVGTWIGNVMQGGDLRKNIKHGAALARIAPREMAVAGLRRIYGHIRWMTNKLFRSGEVRKGE